MAATENLQKMLMDPAGPMAQHLSKVMEPYVGRLPTEQFNEMAKNEALKWAKANVIDIPFSIDEPNSQPPSGQTPQQMQPPTQIGQQPPSAPGALPQPANDDQKVALSQLDVLKKAMLQGR